MCMINRISVDNTSRLNSKIARNSKEEGKQNPNFKGVGAIALAGIQACERMPMVNVTVIDMLSAILPRTIVESMTNWFAGFEAFRRESSGLVVNCLIPSIITLGLAKCFNPAIMPKGVDMSRCWADSSLIDKAKEYYTNSNSNDKIYDSLKNILGDIQGFEGKNKIIFKEALGEESLNNYAKKLSDIARSSGSDKEMRKEVKKLTAELIQKTSVAENIKIAGKKEVKAGSVGSMLEDSVKFFREFHKSNGKVSIEEFAKQSKKLVKTKSLAGLAVVLPLAISMQYINRWITGKLSGVKGAPIYDDFGKNKENIEESPKAKEGLFKQKLISISSMLGVSLLSMMKMPSMNMLEFKGMFPTMDQARIISTATFSSRMAAADDKNELAESTVRDIATFSGLYFLGDYAAKGTATIIEKTTGISLLNDTKPLEKNAGIFKKFAHWVKDVTIKSSEEVVSKTQKELKGLAPTKEQALKIEKELQKARNLRSACQAANLGVSLALLGIIVPIFTRKKTKKQHEQDLKLAQEKNVNSKDEQPLTPLNVKYSNLTTGFRADKQIA